MRSCPGIRGSLFGSLLSLCACATIVTGTTDTVRIESTPPGATVEFQGQVVTTPSELTVSRSLFSQERAHARLDGYYERTFKLAKRFNMWTIGNIVTLGLGLPIDVLSGAFMKFQPEHHFVLTPEDED